MAALMVCGDIESNPAPPSEEVVGDVSYERCLVEGLAQLCSAAPSEPGVPQNLEMRSGQDYLVARQVIPCPRTEGNPDLAH